MKSCKIGVTRSIEEATSYQVVVGGPKSPIIRARYHIEGEMYTALVGDYLLTQDELEYLNSEGCHVGALPATVISGNTILYLYPCQCGFVASSSEKIFIFRGSDLLQSVLDRMQTGGCTVTAADA